MLSSPAAQHWRLSASAYKFFTVSHISVSVGWLGIVIAKLMLEILALRSPDPTRAIALYNASELLNPVFPPAAIATLVTGAVLAVGTRWGLFGYYWVIAKIVLTFGVIITAIRIGDRLVAQAMAGITGATPATGAVEGSLSDAMPLLALTGAHLLMLVTANVLSIYKPWGRTWLGKRPTPQKAQA